MTISQQSALPTIRCSMIGPSTSKLDSEIKQLSHVSTKDQVADFLINGLGPVSLSRLCEKMGLVDIFRPS